MSEWQQVSRCVECHKIFGEELKWMHGHFVPVCPNCGVSNGGYFGCFESVTVRAVRSRWLNRFVRWEFRNEKEDTT